MFTIGYAVINKIVEDEGRYSNDPDDPGGETYCGISSVHHPDWSGWGEVRSEEDKDSNGLFTRVRPLVFSFWTDYLTSTGTNRVPEYLQYQFVQAVATSPKLAMAAVQQLAVWSFPAELRQQDVDGLYGPKTQKYIERLNGMPTGREQQMGYALAVIDGYAQRAREMRKQKFLRGWIMRTLRAWEEAASSGALRQNLA